MHTDKTNDKKSVDELLKDIPISNYLTYYDGMEEDDKLYDEIYGSTSKLKEGKVSFSSFKDFLTAQVFENCEKWDIITAELPFEQDPTQHKARPIVVMYKTDTTIVGFQITHVNSSISWKDWKKTHDIDSWWHLKSPLLDWAVEGLKLDSAINYDHLIEFSADAITCNYVIGTVTERDKDEFRLSVGIWEEGIKKYNVDSLNIYEKLGDIKMPDKEEKEEVRKIELLQKLLYNAKFYEMSVYENGDSLISDIPNNAKKYVEDDVIVLPEDTLLLVDDDNKEAPVLGAQEVYDWFEDNYIIETDGVNSDKEDLREIIDWLVNTYNVVPSKEVQEYLELSIKDLDNIKDEGLLNHNRPKLTGKEHNELAQDIYKYLENNDIYPIDIYSQDSENSLSDILLEIVIEGDWKHDHLACDYLVEKYCRENGLVIAKQYSEEIYDSESEGSDWGKESHYYEILFDNDTFTGDEVIKSLRKMFNSQEDDEFDFEKVGIDDDIDFIN